MKNRKKILSIILCVTLVISSLSFAFASESAAGDAEQTYMQQVIEKLGERIEGEDMFDYLSYVYLGWRNTGGSWQNQVIDTFVIDQLKAAGYTHNGAATTPEGQKSANDKSSATDDDYSWVTYFNVASDAWDPEYAKLEVTVDEDFAGKAELIEKINVDAYAFDPTCDTYLDHYGMDSIDDMWSWITEKDAAGNRINVLNGKEAELNKRVHLARNSCFTEAGGTKPADAVGVTGEVVYVGTVDKNGTTASALEGLKGDALKAKLEGKVLLSDSSLSNAFNLAKNVGAVAVMSKSSLDTYSVPRDENGQIIAPFEKSARYAGGASLSATKAQTAAGSPIVEWQFSNEQFDSLKALLEKATKPVIAKNISIGDVYAMNDPAFNGKGQAVAIAEIKGATKPDERVFICAHVQEPGANDNATGVAALLGLATEMKKMVDDGTIERPERTITFMWGDEMSMAKLYLNSHPDEKAKVVSSLDMDMVGEDPAKTGGVMRIEKTPDPSAVYNYTLDTLPWEDGNAYDETFKDTDGNFVRLPDSHTLWGAGSIKGIFNTGFFLNDAYMYAAQQVIKNHDDTFQVDVCPYEGGSDHTVFLQNQVPAMLTWHFTDYTYHTSVDSLAMSSAREMENVGITTMATALLIANAGDDNEDIAAEMLVELYNAAMTRFEKEEQNTLNHQVFAKGNGEDYEAALENEIEVLTAWHDWYQEALLSVEGKLMESPSAEYKALRASLALGLELRLDEAINFAEEMIKAEPAHTDVIAVPAKPATAEADGNIAYWYCKYCGKYYSDEALTQEIAFEDTVVKFVPDEGGEGTVTPPDKGEVPKTGDGNNVGVMLVLLAASGIAGSIVYKKRREDIVEKAS